MMWLPNSSFWAELSQAAFALTAVPGKFVVVWWCGGVSQAWLPACTQHNTHSDWLIIITFFSFFEPFSYTEMLTIIFSLTLYDGGSEMHPDTGGLY